MVDASTGVAMTRGDDPHIWHDPRNAEVMVANIEAALAKADPDHAPTTSATWRPTRQQLETLDASNAAQIATLTDKQLVTNHDAFGYYVRALRPHVRRLDHPELRHVGRAVGIADRRHRQQDRGDRREGGLLRDVAARRRPRRPSPARPA